MHEYALIEDVVKNIVGQIREQAGEGKHVVKIVELKVGAFDLHTEKSFRELFVMISQGTPLHGAEIKILVVPATLKCPNCEFIGPFQQSGDEAHHHPVPVTECPRCRSLTRVEGGRGVEVAKVTVEKA